MLVAETGCSANVTSDVPRGRERAAVVLLRFEDHDVDFWQEQQHQRHRRRCAHSQTQYHRSALQCSITCIR